MLERVKLALRITTDAFNAEIEGLINAGLLDLGVAGVNEYEPTTTDELIITAVVTYCRLHFGECDNYDRLKASYDEQKAQLSMCSNYNGGEING